MASNGLVANPTKTTLMILNNKGNKQVEIVVGKTKVKQENIAKLVEVPERHF